MSYSPTAPEPSTANSTATPLGGSATFTGTWELASRSMVLVQSFSDVAGTVYFDFSVDGVNADSTFPTNGVPATAGVPAVIPAAVAGRYFRVRYVNGSVAQTTFRLGTSFADFSNFYAPLNQALGLTSPAILTRPTLPWLDIARGLVTGMQVVEKFGYNEDVGTTFEPISYGGVYQTPTSAVSLEFVSSSTVDALDDTGAHEITVEGLDANYDMQTVSTAAHATDGLTAVAIGGTWTRVHRAYVSASGTYALAGVGSHAGTITIRAAGGGATYATIPVINSFPMSQSLIGVYSIPRNYSAYIFLKDVTADTGKTINYGFFYRENADDVLSSYAPMRLSEIRVGLTGGSVFPGSSAKVPMGPFTGPCDMGFMGYSSGGGGNAVCTVEFEIFLVNET